MERELLVVSVTRLGTGVCVACVDEHDTWVRPTREDGSGWRQLQVDDLRDDSGRVVVKVGHIVRWPLGASVPRDVHTEDILVGSTRPKLVRVLASGDLLARCGRLREPSLIPFLCNRDRSLTMFTPQTITCFEFSSAGKGGVSARLRFEHGPLRDNFSVTDLRWRAFARSILTARAEPSLSWTESDLQRHAGLRIRYLVVGRGQTHNPPHRLAGPFWPFVTTVFTDPAVGAEIDYANL